MADSYEKVVQDVGAVAEVAPTERAFLSLKNRVQVTRDARYAARKRLQSRHLRAYYIVSLLSLFVIVVSVIPNVFKLSPQATQMLLLVTIVNSVFIIITTLVDATKNYSLEAFQMQESGRKLDRIFNKVLLASEEDKSSPEWLMKKHGEYQDILEECPVDHQDVDYLFVQVHKPFLFEYLWKSYSPARQRFSAIYRIILLIYLRNCWLIPHVLMVATSLYLVGKLIFDEKALLSV